MRYFRQTFYSIFLLLLLLSCEKEVQMDFDKPQRLTLNCILNPDSTIHARLTLSRNIDTNYEFETVDDATILLYKNEELWGELSANGNGNYSLNSKPISTNTYQIRVVHPNFPEVLASTKVPKKPRVSISSDTIRYDNQGKFFHINAYYSIHDKAIEENAYWLGSIDINAPFVDDFNRSLDTDSKYGYVYDYYVRISDEGYDGQDLAFELETVTGMSRIIWAPDPNYDKYLKSSLKVQLNKEGDLPFQEPMQIYSNIKNAYGIFGSCAITTINQ